MVARCGIALPEPSPSCSGPCRLCTASAAVPLSASSAQGVPAGEAHHIADDHLAWAPPRCLGGPSDLGLQRCQDLLRQPTTQAESRPDLRSKLSVNAGGVVFTTIQKFFPEATGVRHPTLSNRRNIVVIADEAHRSQYDFIDGFARHMRDALPRASFVKSLARRSSSKTRTHGPSSAITSACTTSSARSAMARPYRSTTKAAWRSSRWTQRIHSSYLVRNGFPPSRE